MWYIFVLVTLPVCCGLTFCFGQPTQQGCITGNESKPGGSLWLIPLMKLYSQTYLQGCQQEDAWTRESPSTKLSMRPHFYLLDNRQIKGDKEDRDVIFLPEVRHLLLSWHDRETRSDKIPQRMGFCFLLRITELPSLTEALAILFLRPSFYMHTDVSEMHTHFSRKYFL